jgi:hypothetical protein
LVDDADAAAQRTTLGLDQWRLTTVSGTDADTTMSTNSLYVVDMNAWVTADRTYTLPASPTVGDRVAVQVQVGNTAFELILKSNTGQAFTNTTGLTAIEWSRLFISGECVVFRYVASNLWLIEIDGRIPMKGLFDLTTAATTSTAATFVYATSNSGAWTSRIDVGGIVDVTTDKMTCRRACYAQISVGGRTNSTVTDQKYFNSGIELNGTTLILAPFVVASVSGLKGQNTGTILCEFAASDYIRYKFRTEEANKGLELNIANYMSFAEILP